MKAPLHMATSRLILSQPSMNDANAVFERYASDPDVTHFLGWPRHQSVGDTRAFLDFSAAQWEQWPAGPYLIKLRSDGRLLGSTGFAFMSPSEAIVGYVLAKDAWGHGYATEALRAMVQVARQVGVRRLCAPCHPQNVASWRVLEKCGFVRDSSRAEQVEFPNLAPGMPQDAFYYMRILEPSTTDEVVRC